MRIEQTRACYQFKKVLVKVRLGKSPCISHDGIGLNIVETPFIGLQQK